MVGVLCVPAWTQQGSASVSSAAESPQSAAPVTPATPPPAPKKKKKTKAEPVPAPVVPEDMCSVTFHTEVFGQGAVSSVNLAISPQGPGADVRGMTGPNGDFQLKLAPGEYQITADLGPVTARQNAHIPKGGTTVVMIEMPAQPKPTIPTPPSGFPH